MRWVSFPYRFIMRMLMVGALIFVVLPDMTAQQDTTQSRQLDEVLIHGEGGQGSLAQFSTAAVQTLSAKEIRHLPTLQLSDALKFMSGVVVKDYGGVGGLKTVSVRGLGSQHTGVLYDGIPLTDCQTGQIDLGKLSLENVSAIELTVGTDEHVLLPARAHSYSNLIKISTFHTLPQKPFQFKASFTMGAYQMYNPMAQITHLLQSKKHQHRYLIWGLNVQYLHSEGNYPFILHYGGANDSTSHEIRQNTDISVFSTELNALWQLRQGEQLSVKGYYYTSDRGLPSATIFYNLYNRQRLSNRNGFGQMSYRKMFNNCWSYLLNAKFNYDYTHYVDPDYLNDMHRLDNTYEQYEGYVSNAVSFAPLRKKSEESGRALRHDLLIGLANDLFYNQLESNNIDYEHPARFTTLTALSARYDSRPVTINGNLLLTTVNNIAQDTAVGKTFLHLSPALSVSWRAHKHIQLRAFYKDIFRMPTFNDLYYREVGNLRLKPEKTQQWDLGLVMETPKLWRGTFNMAVTLDGYYNIVRDKIVAFPTRNLFSWSMLNYGVVHIAGAELTAKAIYTFHRDCLLIFQGNVTYQHAVDRTDADSPTYGHQIPYTPRWSGSVSATIRLPFVSVTYAVLISGERYALGENMPANLVAGYADHSLSIQHESIIKGSTLGFKFELLNLSNQNYEIVLNYPMQGAGFRLKAYVQF
ncbi:MAG: TonB-dependent receptor [Bacteroidales bacterium]|nr:TonB-dependent receptor [Bacteroidales bacterium]